MGNAGPGNGAGGEDVLTVAWLLRCETVGGEEDRGGNAVELLPLILPGGAEVAFEMALFFQMGITVGRQHLAVGVDVDAFVFGLDQQLFQIA